MSTAAIKNCPIPVAATVDLCIVTLIVSIAPFLLLVDYFDRSVAL